MIIAYLSRTWQTILVSAVLILSAYLWGQHIGAGHERTKADAERSAANVIALGNARSADEAAAVARVDSAIDIAQTQKELTDAIAAIPDTVPDAQRVALGCQRLHQAGTIDADLPAVCGRGGIDGDETAPVR